jgi:hypothetical protein
MQPRRAYKGVLAVSMHALPILVHSGEGGHRKEKTAHEFARDGPLGVFHQYHNATMTKASSGNVQQDAIIRSTVVGWRRWCGSINFHVTVRPTKKRLK